MSSPEILLPPVGSDGNEAPKLTLNNEDFVGPIASITNYYVRSFTETKLSTLIDECNSYPPDLFCLRPCYKLVDLFRMSKKCLSSDRENFKVDVEKIVADCEPGYQLKTANPDLDEQWSLRDALLCLESLNEDKFDWVDWSREPIVTNFAVVVGFQLARTQCVTSSGSDTRCLIGIAASIYKGTYEEPASVNRKLPPLIQRGSARG
ncbi:hypothetical protein DER46DRAFT_578696 [Fusarium sp. MPI-SDFR-AT-0072]|nr:hypothetical protein DER46DRAFT_578696 [Fusarium sp. MPI-SDFR-AT-0072]